MVTKQIPRVIAMRKSHKASIMRLLLHLTAHSRLSTMGAFLWDNPDQDK